MKMVIVENYDELDRLPKEEDVEVLVRSSGFRYRWINGQWTFVGTREGKGSAGENL